MRRYVRAKVPGGIFLHRESRGGVRSNERDGDLDDFVEGKGCRVIGYRDQVSDDKRHATRFPQGEYVSLSCRVHDEP